MTFGADSIGQDDDRATLSLAGEDAIVFKSYEIKQSVLTQPAAFSLRLGWGDVARELIRRFPPNTPFELRIGNVVQQTGRTDGFEASGESGATELSIRGRDALAPLHDACVLEDQSFSDMSYADLVEAALEKAVPGTTVLHHTNEANRKAITGVNVTKTSDASDETAQKEITKTQAKRLQAKVGERWYEFLKRQLDRAGLFLWAATDGSFVLSTPNTQQLPTYRIVRRRGQERNEVNVTSARYKHETTGRYSEAVCYCRGGGKALGRTKSRGAFTDAEMVELGIVRPLTFKDEHGTSLAQAEFLARRKIAESRRMGWQLAYTLSGHTTPKLGSGERAVWAVDTMVEVIDDEFGLEGAYWIEGVEFRSAPTTTTLHLMRPEDLLFGEEAA